MRRILQSCGLALALAGLAGNTAAQVSARPPLAMTGIPQTSSVSAANHPGVQPAESKAVSGMLAAQNQIRSRLNLSQLSWSVDLAAQATDTAKAASARACGKSNAMRVGENAGAAVYWAAPL